MAIRKTGRRRINLKIGRIFAVLFAAVLCFAMFAINSQAFPGGSLAMNRQSGVGIIMPDTGGIGITIFYVVGIALMTGAVLYLIFKKKKDV